MIQGDARNTLIKTISDKKKIFQEYINGLKKEERREQRNKIDQIRDNFVDMMREVGKKLTSESKFYKAAGQFIQDLRWKQVDEKDREALF